ncbi:MAG: NAD(P)-dependent oxidoreductase [Acidimicrobiia bacterium]|nr:NAD(P)-dependent oxidoreductase [Acidimicrobiia bacterium]
MITGFLHPGAMGASLAGACGGERLWVGAGRSGATHERAEAAGLEDVGSLAALAHRAEVVVSVCPPAAAVAQAEAVAATGFEGIYVDANAVAPSTARQIGSLFDRFVDGGIIGPPIGEGWSTRLYLAGDDAPTVAARWEHTPLEVRVLDGPPGAASAVKACFAAWTKGTAAMLLAVRALARAEDVEEALLAEWATSMPDLTERSELSAVGTAPKAWRFVGEMTQIAEAFAEHGLPDGFHTGAAEIYRSLAGFKDDPGPSFDAVADALLADDPLPADDPAPTDDN